MKNIEYSISPHPVFKRSQNKVCPFNFTINLKSFNLNHQCLNVYSFLRSSIIVLHMIFLVVVKLFGKT